MRCWYIQFSQETHHEMR